MIRRQGSPSENTPPRHRRPPTSHPAAVRRIWFVALVIALFIAAASTASASWTSTGSGTGSASVGTLAAPTNIAATATTGGNTVSLSWTPSTVPSGQSAQGYYVTRVNNADSGHVPACGTTPTAPTSAASCTDPGVPDGSYRYLVTAVYNSWTAVSAPSNSVTVRAASRWAFTGQPTPTVAGASISPGIAVTVQDTAGNPITLDGISVTVAIGTNPGGGTLSGTATALTNTSGVATFGSLSIDKASTGYTLTANGAGLTAATSSGFTITAAAAAGVAFGQQPGSTVAGASITPVVTVRVLDRFGNLTTSSAAVTLAIGTNPANGTLTGTTTQSAAAGIASFGGLSIDKAGTGYTLTATSSGLTGATSTPFAITGAAPNRFVITSSALSGAASATATLGPITVQQQDSFGNPVVAPTGGTTVNLTSNSAGTKIFAATSGGPSVTLLTIPAGSSTTTFYYGDNKAGGPTITVSGTLTSATQTETITAAAAASLAFNQQPTNAVAGAAIAPALTVGILDQFGNLTSSAVAVTVAIGTNPAAGSLSGTQTQTSTSGVASFGGLSIDRAGTGYTLTAISGTLTGATSNPFAITSGAATRFIFTSSALSSAATSSATLGPITVQAQDNLGNPVVAPTGGTIVNLTSNSPATKLFAGTSGGPSVTSVTILAGSANASFYYGDTKAGSPVITASGPLTSATQIETIAAASPAAFVITSAVLSGVAAATATMGPISVEIRDSFGNRATAPAGGITAALASSSTGTRIFSGTQSGPPATTVTFPAGTSIAQFYYGDNKAGTPTVTISAAGLASASQIENITAAGAFSLTFSQQPSTTRKGATIAPPVTVLIVDQFGNKTTSNASVTIAIQTNAGTQPGTLAGTLTGTAASGVATFSDLSISGGNVTGVGYTLGVTAAGLTGATSNPFNIT